MSEPLTSLQDMRTSVLRARKRAERRWAYLTVGIGCAILLVLCFATTLFLQFEQARIAMADMQWYVQGYIGETADMTPSLENLREYSQQHPMRIQLQWNDFTLTKARLRSGVTGVTVTYRAGLYEIGRHGVRCYTFDSEAFKLILGICPNASDAESRSRTMLVRSFSESVIGVSLLAVAFLIIEAFWSRRRPLTAYSRLEDTTKSEQRPAVQPSSHDLVGLIAAIGGMGGALCAALPADPALRIMGIVLLCFNLLTLYRRFPIWR